MAQLKTRRLGRTDRQVTTLGLGGQASIQWTADGVDPIAIIEKAYRLGINYIDTSNVYGPSQANFGEAFRRLGLSPAAGNYDASAREKLFIASKTHIRTGRRPDGETFRTDWSEGMLDDFGVQTAVDDVRRSLSLMFGDGQGNYPEGAYLDCIQFHNINTMDEVDMLFDGFYDRRPDRSWMGALPAMLDLREGTNRTGCNPKKEKLVRHIGITGHWNTAAHIYAIQRHPVNQSLPLGPVIPWQRISKTAIIQKVPSFRPAQSPNFRLHRRRRSREVELTAPIGYVTITVMFEIPVQRRTHRNAVRAPQRYFAVCDAFDLKNVSPPLPRN